MSRSLRIALFLGAVCCLGLVAVGCSVASVQAPSNLVVGESGPLRLFAKDGGEVNIDRCNTFFAPSGIASVGPRNADGVPTLVALAPGTTTLSVECGGAPKATTITVWKAVTSFSVTPTATVADGLTTPLAATFTYTDGTTEDVTARSTWSTSDTAVAVMDGYGTGPGEVTGVSPGSTGYSASLTRWTGGPQYTASGTVTVGPAVLAGLTISPITDVTAGETAQFQANGIWSDGTLTDESATTTWTTSDAGVLMVDTFSGTNGRVFGVDAGQATITGTRSGKSASILVRVTGDLQSISMTPDSYPALPGISVDLTVTASYTGPSGPYVRVVTPWPTFTPSFELEILRSGDAVAVRTLFPFGGSVEASLAGTSDITYLFD